MKKLIGLLITLLPCFCCYAISGPNNDEGSGYKTYNQKYYKNTQFDSNFFGHLAALTGEVVKVELGPNELPIFQIKLTGLDRTLWVASVTHVQEKQLNIGDKLDVLGFFDKTALENEFVAKLTQDPEYLLGFCIHVSDIGLPIYFRKVLDKCLQWENGTLNMEIRSR